MNNSYNSHLVSSLVSRLSSWLDFSIKTWFRRRPTGRNDLRAVVVINTLKRLPPASSVAYWPLPLPHANGINKRASSLLLLLFLRGFLSVLSCRVIAGADVCLPPSLPSPFMAHDTTTTTTTHVPCRALYSFTSFHHNFFCSNFFSWYKKRATRSKLRTGRRQRHLGNR